MKEHPIAEVINELADAVLEHEAEERGPFNFSDETLMSAIHIFSAAIMDKMWDLQEEDGTPPEQRMNEARIAGEDIRKLVIDHTGIDPIEYFKKDSPDNVNK